MCVCVCVCLTLCLIGFILFILHVTLMAYFKANFLLQDSKVLCHPHFSPPPHHHHHHHHPLTPAPWRTALFLTVTPCSFPAGLLNFSLPTPHPHAKGSLVRHFAPVLVGLLILFSPCPIRLTSRPPPPPPPARSPPVLKGSASMSVPCSSGLVLSPHFHPPVSPSYPPLPHSPPVLKGSDSMSVPCSSGLVLSPHLHPPLSPSYPPPPPFPTITLIQVSWLTA